jgi:hypothetical protein
LTLFFLTAAAHAHPAAVPHVHSSEPAAFWVVAVWAFAALGWAGWVLKSPPKQRSVRS